ncbi:MAG: SocA family protein [Desulfurococcales archaeon]|nr:SocA family protein [Desulfurococcales archaeon]
MRGGHLVSGVEALKYILWRMGCTHPFRASRILAIAEDISLERYGRRLTDLKYVKGPGVFFIEGLKEAVEGDPSLRKREGDPKRGVKGCIEYVGGDPPSIPEEARRVLDEVIERYGGLPDMELNAIAMKSRVLS